MPTPAEILRRLHADPTKPRITTYEDTPGPTQGERIELSARVLGNWVNKAANLLQDEFDLSPGDHVLLALPPHWRTLYWALAVWSVGATVSLETDPAPSPTVVVTDSAGRAADAVATGTDTVLVTLAALARSAATSPAPGVLDEARELATYPDAFNAYADPDPDDDALRTDAGHTAYEDLAADPRWPAGTRVHLRDADTGDFLLTALEVFSGEGSIVLSRGTSDDTVLRQRSVTEGATAEAL